MMYFMLKWVLVAVVTFLFNLLLDNLGLSFILAYINSNICDVKVKLKEVS